MQSKNVMTTNERNFSIKTINSKPLDIHLSPGEALFILGANGTGKSALIQEFNKKNPENTIRILANRQIFINNNSLEITSAQKKSSETQIKQKNIYDQMRWIDPYASQKASISLHNLIDSENIRARKIAKACDEKNNELRDSLSKQPSSFQIINDIFMASNLDIVISISGENEEILASKNNSEPYSISELSDGERTSLLIAADVLTAPPGCLFLIDEPEKHLHRSISSPLLNSLFEKRKDCFFMISTHDVSLPSEHTQAKILLLRNCRWVGKKIESWDADFLKPENNLQISKEIPDEIKQKIFGSKRKILFVEGESLSLDVLLYQLIFSDFTVVAQGNCSQVEKAVKGLKETSHLNWLDCWGIIDRDDRDEDQIAGLNLQNIAVLDFYSIESIYYNLDIIKKVAEQQNSNLYSNNEKGEELYTNATSKISDEIKKCKENLCKKLCQRKIRNEIQKFMPTMKNIDITQEFTFSYPLQTVYKEELKKFNIMISNGEIEKLISRYPLKETGVPSSISSELKFQTLKDYQGAVRRLIEKDEETKKICKSLLKNVLETINKNSITASHG